MKNEPRKTIKSLRNKRINLFLKNISSASELTYSMKRTIGIICMVMALGGNAHAQDDAYLEKGQFSFGMRTTTSLFGHDNIPGLGVGGQMRWQFFDFLNTEWFADWITIDLNGAGTRNNAHIGWSVLFYPKKFGKFTPYAIAGHCFDYAQVTPFSTPVVDRSADVITRWSSAVQMGLGTHYFLTERFNLSLSAQYMLHLGKHLNYEIQDLGNDTYYLDTNPIGDNHNVGLEGHILLTFSINYRIADLW